MKKRKLAIGLLLDGYTLPAWSYEMIKQIIASDYATIHLVVMNDYTAQKNTTILSKITNNYGQITHLFFKKFLEKLYRKLIERKLSLSNAETIVNAEELLSNISTLKVKTNKKKWSGYFYPEDIEKIKEHNIDIFIRLGFGILRGDILTSAKYGVWSFHHGDNYVNRGGPAGFWESMESWPETGSILQILSEDLDNGKILYRSYSCTNTMSVTDNKSNYYWKSLYFMTRMIKNLYDLGEEAFLERIESKNKHPLFYSKRLYTQPNNFQLAALTFKKIKEKAKLLWNRTFFIEQWILMFHLKNEFSSSLWRYKKIIPPKDRFWADPHIIFRDGDYYIFIEELLYTTNKGHISLMIMDEKGNYQQPELILEKPYHLSYPFVFEHNNELYMIPESSENRTIELYKCTEFPYKWEFQMNLMEEVNAVDTTLFYYQHKWWVFTNLVENDEASTCDELFLFSSDELLSTQWQAHPLNPIVSDCKTARPAGKIFSHNGALYRPSQDCSTRYGYGFNINEIVLIDEHNYVESLVSSVKPDWDKDILATHTFNRVNSLHIIDAIYKRRK